MIYIIVILIFLFILSYFDYKLYDSKKVPKGTPDIVRDIRNEIRKRTTSRKK